VFAVYALIDPRTNRIRYVGCTKNLKARYSLHLVNGRDAIGSPTGEARLRYRDVRTHGYVVQHWVAELIAVGARPELVVLASSTGERRAAQLERFWIKEARASGEPLVNSPNRSCYVGTKARRTTALNS